ncbi:superfamily II DNA/RNA helicase [Aminobacter lissarensis]|uniref:Superfamily II DNA/RNA helicase n=1 Tax=Aminobacter carboxidus TaxID=376165 RepID=A0A8E1WK35_9HYPH|nr:DEAD/DEAH box helicase [Aminobacter lissarensis]MBB6469953.1 superfamily II DNA/RNA helicase [Aminobacter lissarensis]
MPSEAVLTIARTIRAELAGSALSPLQAKLYSQRVRRDMGADGLTSFRAAELTARLDEACLLLEAGWLERSANDGRAWTQAVKRAAEILEWISHAALKPPEAPIHLLSAAAYQVAGYPAMALGHLRTMPAGEAFSTILREFLRGDFDAALSGVQAFWKIQHDLGEEHVSSAEIVADEDGEGRLVNLELSTVRHVIMCIGTICSYLRTGETALVGRALVKLDALAQSYLHSRDPYSYLLARLCAGAAHGFIDASLWPHIERLADDVNSRARAALTQFARAAFVNRRALVWPAQRDGIDRLAANDSFVLCTPTGSGKTTIATLGAVQGLFAPRPDPFLAANLVLYLVPSRALAAEVETRFAEDLRGIAAEPVVVTGLYGGTDWGPTDAWVQIDQPTVVICTFEKADALLRYLGTLFLDRVRLVVIDEAHMVEQDPSRTDAVIDGTSRALRLEQLSARLLRAQDDKGFRIIALSAVAAKAAPAIASWLSSDEDGDPISSTYRSTRQMLGRLEVSRAGQFDIRYDLMDGRTLEFEDERADDRPFIPRPFPSVPDGVDSSLGVEKSLRGPTLWAALHLAAERPDGTRPTVMISLTQFVSAFAGTCADLIEAWTVEEVALPNYWSVADDDPHWQSCLAAAEDYFTKQSFEYRLLVRGIAVHHGQMPALLARRLKVAIDRGNVRVVIATSTLSEGVNIPVNTLLIPSVHRSNSVFTVNEFSNLIGRAGRPGVATEGNALVVLPHREYRGRGRSRRLVWNRTWEGYEELIDELKEATELASTGDLSVEEGTANSALAMLLERLRDAWEELSSSDDDDEFAEWLEKTAVVDGDGGENSDDSYTLLDTLDGLLIAAIQEIEQMRTAGLGAAELETELSSLWRRTYAHVAAEEEDRLAQTWLGRGRAITSLYPDAKRRRQIYKTSLPPRSGSILLDRIEEMRTTLQSGSDYADRTPEQQFQFVRAVIALLGEVPAFRISTKLGRKKKPFSDWEKLLRWWLFKTSLKKQPQPKELGPWFAFVADNFIYRGNWGLGSLVGVLMDEGDAAGPVDALTMEDWPRSGLPWIGFWLKELVNWGTLDPVAAFLLARGNARDRRQAEADAQDYYTQLDETEPNDKLDPRRIRDWAEERQAPAPAPPASRDIVLDVRLERPAHEYLVRKLSVLPLVSGDALRWIDPAGYAVAHCDRPANWDDQSSRYRFELSVDQRQVTGETYLPHRNGTP